MKLQAKAMDGDVDGPRKGKKERIAETAPRAKTSAFVEGHGAR